MSILKLQKDRNNGQYTYSEIIQSGTTGNIVQLPNDANTVSVAILPEAGSTGKVQYTLDNINFLETNTATWLDWPGGNVTENTADGLLTPVTAFRGVSVSGIVNFRLVG